MDTTSSGMTFAAYLPVASSLCYVDQLLYPTGVGEGLGILHVLAGDLVQGAADRGHRLVRQDAWAVASWEPIDQVSHRVFTWKHTPTEPGQNHSLVLQIGNCRTQHKTAAEGSEKHSIKTCQEFTFYTESRETTCQFLNFFFLLDL